MNLSQEQMLQLKNDLLDAKITPLFKKYLEVVIDILLRFSMPLKKK